MAEEGVCPFVSLYSFVRSEVVLDVVVGVLGRGRVVELELLGVEVLRREIHYIHEIALSRWSKLREFFMQVKAEVVQGQV